MEAGSRRPARAIDNGNRPTERYLEAFDNIRKMHRYVKSLAVQNDVAVIPSFNLDATLSQVIDLVVGQAFEAVPDQPTNKNNSKEITHSA